MQLPCPSQPDPFQHSPALALSPGAGLALGPRLRHTLAQTNIPWGCKEPGSCWGCLFQYSQGMQRAWELLALPVPGSTSCTQPKQPEHISVSSGTVRASPCRCWVSPGQVVRHCRVGRTWSLWEWQSGCAGQHLGHTVLCSSSCLRTLAFILFIYL